MLETQALRTAFSASRKHVMAEEQAQSSERPEAVRRRRPARRAILEAARRVLIRDGSEGLSPEAVVRESGMSHDIVYAYFCNRDELLLSIAADELSALSRAARDTENTDPKTAASMGILDLPKMVESFMIARAAAGADEENDSTGEDAEDDDAVEDDKSEIAMTDSSGNMMPHRDVPRVPRRQGAREIDGLVKEIASRDGQGEGGINAAVARLERRVYVIERSLVERAEQAEKAAAKPIDPATFSTKDLASVGGRLEMLEKRLMDIASDFDATKKHNADRLRILEATPPAGPSHADSVPGMRDAPVTPSNVVSFDDILGIPGEDSQERGLEDILAAARQAAKKAVAEPRNAEKRDAKGGTSSWGKWFRKSERGGKSLLLTRVAPIALLAVGLVALARTMDAGELPSSDAVPAVASPGTAVALGTVPSPLETITPFDQLMAAAEIGDAKAQTALGLHYLNGDAVAANEDEAVRWLQRAAEGGQAVAQYNLATLYSREDHAMFDPATAKYWYEAAAEQGNRMAMNNLAMFYAQGLGTEQNTTEAAHWFQFAAALGYQVAQFNLAVLYERGDGVPQDIAEAYKWYAIAATQGDEDALNRAAFLAPKMDRAAFERVQAEVESFEPAPLDPVVNEPPVFESQKT
ncbi:MAG: localization factor PodJL [Pseudomonadota bacterium]|jgi:TPR repeat protein